MPFTHPFVSAKSDGADATLVRPSNWNADHAGDNTLARNLTQVEVVNTVTETSIFSFAIPAGALGTNGGVQLLLAGDYLNNSAGTRTFTIRVKLGSTTVLTAAVAGIAQSANRRKWHLTVWFLNSAAAAQKWAGHFEMSINTTATFKVSKTDVDENYTGVGQASSSEDTALARTLDVTLEHSAAEATMSFQKEIAHLDLIAAS